MTDSESLNQVYERLQNGFASRDTFSVDFRLSELRKLRAFLQSTESDLLAALNADVHKKEVEAVGYDLSPIYSDLNYFMRHLSTLAKPTFASRDFGAPVYVHRQPKGLVLIFSAFNFNIMLGVRPVIDAIAAGNVVCLKPSEHATASERYLQRLTSVLDPRICAVVTGGPQRCTELLELKWDHILYTGNANIGRIVMAAAAKHLTPVTLELGGKSPAIVSASADVRLAAASIAKGHFINAGQVCLAPDYCLVEEEVYAEFVKKLVTTVREFYTDDPKSCRHFGRIISSRHVERIAGLVNASEGRIILGGDYDDSASHYFSPTVVEVANGDDALMQEELFGPVLPILKVKSADEAISFINGRERPLALYLFSRDDDVTKTVITNTISGSVGINETILQIGGRGSFIGGIGESGIGAYGGKEGFETFSHKRPVMYSSSLFGRMFQLLLPTFYSTKDGKDNAHVARVTRFVCQIPQTTAGETGWCAKIANIYGGISVGIAAMCAEIGGSVKSSKED